MKIKDFYINIPKFVAAFDSVYNIPTVTVSEIAFIGKSNVGKSSLINAIFNSAIAKTSATPGRTQTLNFFNHNDLLSVVDLPGYGFAKAPKDLVKKWNENVNLYLKGRVELKRVFLLIDVRRGLQNNDASMMKMLDDNAVNYQIIITKCDKVKDTEIEKIKTNITEIYKIHPAMHPTIIATSSENGMGLLELRGEIFDLVK